MGISEQEIWACANEVIRRYGDAASFHAAQRADEFLEKSDIPGHRTWLHPALHRATRGPSATGRAA